ncbi:MAG: cation-translocating P-type ATPase [Sporomusaceae bacterium]|nr:cation-translocating P-type ATPase [Sporomusaceae bacterium]
MHDHHLGGHLKDYSIISITAILLGGYWLGYVPQILGIDTTLIAAIISGLPIVLEAIKAILQRGDTKVGLLVSIAIIAAVAIGEYLAAAEVALIMTFGEMLEHMTLEKSNSALQKLAELTPLKARLFNTGEEQEIDAELVQVGDHLLVKPGDKIPVDGVVVAGFATVDQSTITGESIPVERSSGDNVFGGTIASLGSIEIVATKVGQDTALGHIIEMVKTAQDSKAPIARIVDRWANWFVPLSLTIAALVYIVTGDIVRSVTILIVFCPCAMLLSTPTAVAAAIGSAARRGILIKGGDILEAASRIDTLVLDKTGTVTIGKPRLKELHCYENWNKSDVLAIAAGMEKRSEHHLAKAIIEAAEVENISLAEPTSWQHIVGQGIVAEINDQKFLLGNKTLFEAQGIVMTEQQITYCENQQSLGGTVILFAAYTQVAAILVVQDPVRQEAAAVLKYLFPSKLKNLVMLTGDALPVGKAIAAELNIPIVHGDLLPADKVSYVEKYQDLGHKVAMVGDGINDAPALVKADIGIAMGYSGTDIAMEAADIALLSDDLAKIPEAIDLSKQAYRTIWQNIFTANLINIVAIVFATLGLLGPIAAAIVHNAGAILVVLNSARLLRRSTTPIEGILPQSPSAAVLKSIN